GAAEGGDLTMIGGRFDPFSGEGPRWRAVPAWRPFLEDLAAGVLDWLGDAPPETLTDATILLPNRRAARAFSFALGKLAGARPASRPRRGRRGPGSGARRRACSPWRWRPGPRGWGRWASSIRRGAARPCCAVWPRRGTPARRRPPSSPPGPPAPCRPPPMC